MPNTDTPTSVAKLPKQDDNSPVSSNDAGVPVNKRKILDQYLKEKLAAMRVRQVKINNWIRNEELYNGVTQRTLLTRANLHVPKVFESVHNMSARLGEAPDVDYDTKPEGDENASEIMKHLFIEDALECGWDLTFENSKVEAGIYGRGVWKIIPGNKSNRFELVDTMSFLISPIAKNTKDALYCGQQFIYKTMSQIEQDAQEFGYDEAEVKRMKEQRVPAESQQDTSSEASVKNIRLANMGLANVTQYGSKVAEITEWYTFIAQDDADQKKVIPYVLTVANDEYLLRAVPVKDAGIPRNNPYISFGIFTRGITFWCPGVADVQRDPNLAINLALNQIMDNNTYRNFGMLFVSSNSGLKQSSIVPRPLGVTAVTTQPNENVKDKVWQYTPPDISSAASTMQIINSFGDNAVGLGSGVPSGQKGKVSVTQQAAIQAQMESKTNVIKRNIIEASRELYQLYADTAKLNFTIPRNVKVFGYKQLTIENVTKKNFEGIEFLARATPVESSQENKAIKQKARVTLFEMLKDDPKVPGQLALRRDLAKQFDVPAETVEAYFQQEEQMPQPEQPTTPGQPGGAGQPGAPAPEGTPAPTPATALLGQTQAGAQAQVPPRI